MPTDHNTSTPLRQVIELFMLDCESRRLTRQTRQYYQARLNQAASWLAGRGVTTLEAITSHHLREFFADMVHRGLAEDTQATAARVVRTFLRFCVREELLATSPMSKLRLPRPSKRILPAFTEAEVKALLAATADSRDQTRDTAIVLLLLDTGLRASECVALNVGDIDSAGRVMVHQGKGKKDRIVFMGVRSRKMLLRYMMERSGASPTDPLWLSENTGERLTYWGLALLLRRLGRRAGVKVATPHKCRRTFCLWSLRAGMDIVSLSRIMGHEDVSLLRRYAAQLTDDLQAAHRDHGPVDGILKGR